MSPNTESFNENNRRLESVWDQLKANWWLRRYGRFELRPNGVYEITPADKPEDPPEEKFICSWLEVAAQSRNESGEEWGLVLRWQDPDRREHTWSAPRSLIVKQGTELAEILAKGGLRIASGKNTQLKHYISRVGPRQRMLNVPRPGWYMPKGSRVFVLPDQVLGANEDRSDVVLQADSYDPTTRVTKGTLAEWQKHVASLCVGNEILMFAVSIAFAAPLLQLLGKDSGGFHQHGLSSTGKSTALVVADSAWGFQIETWRTTDNALEDTAERHNDVLLALDEFSQVDPRKAAEVAYMLGNGEGKQRLTQAIVPQRKKRWRVLFLSTGEITLADHAEAGGTKTKAGTEVRMVNIDADAGEGMGVFRNLHRYTEPSAFADALKARAREYCGTAGPAFVRWVIEHEAVAMEELRKGIGDFITASVPPDSSGEIFRVAERFGLVGAAGELASEAGISGWKPGLAMDAARWCFDRWLSGRSTGSSDLDKAITQIRAFLLANESRFEEIGKGGGSADPRTVYDRVGFRRRIDDGGTEYLIPTDSFKQLCQGHDAKKVAQELGSRGYLRLGEKNRLQVQHRVPEVANGLRVYAIQSRIFDDAGQDSTADSPSSE